MSSTHHPAAVKSLGCVLKVIVCLLLLAAPCHAQQFQIRYSFTGLPGNQITTLPLADSVPNLLTVSGITRGSGITTVAGSGGMAAGQPPYLIQMTTSLSTCHPHSVTASALIPSALRNAEASPVHTVWNYGLATIPLASRYTALRSRMTRKFDDTMHKLAESGQMKQYP